MGKEICLDGLPPAFEALEGSVMGTGVGCTRHT